MRNNEELPQLSRPIEDSDDDGVKKEKVQRTLREETEPKKDPGHGPGEPSRAALLPAAQPEDEGESKKRNVERFDLDEPALFDHAEIRQPDQGGEERSV